MTRVLILHNIVNPQVLPYFERLAAEPDVDLTVWFAAERTSTRRWATEVRGRFRWEVLPGAQWEIQMEERIALQWNPSVAWRIPRERFDVVVLFAGWDSPTFWLAAAASRACGIPLVLRSGSVSGATAFGGAGSRPSAWRRRLTRGLARRMVASAAAYLAYGTRSERYLIELGAAPDRIYPLWNTVDVESLARTAGEMRGRRQAVRERLGLTPDHVLALYVGRFQPVKHLDSLIEAYLLASQREGRLALGLAGYGPCEAPLRARAAGWPKVFFYGAVEGERLAECYAAADFFVLPSADIWGLVINEAMAFGLPVVASDAAGATDDLVVPGWNGFLYPDGDVAPLAARLVELASDATLRERMGQGSLAHIQKFTYQSAAPNLALAIRRAASASVRDASFALP